MIKKSVSFNLEIICFFLLACLINIEIFKNNNNNKKCRIDRLVICRGTCGSQGSIRGGVLYTVL